LPQSSLELAESLEQLVGWKWYTIKAGITEVETSALILRRFEKG
jgi:hypothetical protein